MYTFWSSGLESPDVSKWRVCDAVKIIPAGSDARSCVVHGGGVTTRRNAWLNLPVATSPTQFFMICCLHSIQL